MVGSLVPLGKEVPTHRYLLERQCACLLWQSIHPSFASILVGALARYILMLSVQKTEHDLKNDFDGYANAEE